MDLKALLQEEQYAFLHTEERLKDRIILLGLAGSHGYGTAREDSDIDLRGVTMNMPSDLIGLTSFEQYEDRATDTVIYSFRKFISLVLSCNPNVIEILGLDPDQYAVCSPAGQYLLDHRHLFLSRRAAASFGHYADAQLRRLENAVARDTMTQSQREKHILSSVTYALENFNNQHGQDQDARLYIDTAITPGLESEIFLDGTFRRMPLRRFNEMLNTLHAVVRDYDNIGRRNRKKDDDHLNKHAMHLIRLFMMGIDILEKEEICTHRPESDLVLLRKIRNGDFMKDSQMTPEFYEVVSFYEQKFKEAEQNTRLPDAPDMDKVEELAETINRTVITEETL